MESRDKLIYSAIILNSFFWSLLVCVLCLHYDTTAFLLLGVIGFGINIIILELTEEDYMDYIKRISQDNDKENLQ